MSRYKIRYLPLFLEELEGIIEYIQKELSNPQAASKAATVIEKAILKRTYNPNSFEAYMSNRSRKHPYYRIYVKNYIIFYVVIDDVMEVRRIIYNKSSYVL